MRLLRILSMPALALAGLCAPSWAAGNSEGGDDVVWRCWWDQGTHVSCTAQQLPATARLDAVTDGLPEIVATLRARPQAFPHRFVHIPLHTHPFDMESVSTLAQAVMCGTQQACSVRFTREPPQAGELDRLKATSDASYALPG